MKKNARLVAAGSVAAAATIIVGSMALPALAGGHKHQPAPAPLAPVGVSSATYGYSLTVTGLSDSSDALTISGTAIVDVTNHDAEITAVLSRAVGPLPAGEIDAIVANKTVYVDAPGLSLLDGGKSWISLSAPSRDSAATAIWTKVSVALGDVPAALAWATSHPASNPLATVTATTTSGDGTTTSLLLHLPHVKARAAGTGLLPTSIPLTVTTDAHGRVATASSSLSFGSVHVSVSLTSTGYDQPVSLSPPPASDVTVLPPGTLSGLAGTLGLAHHATVTGASWLHAAAASATHLGHTIAGDWRTALAHRDNDAA